MKIIEKKISKKLYIKLLVIAMAFICAGAIVLWLWRKGTFLPRWIAWEHGTLQEASGAYEIILARKKVSVRYGDAVIWTSPDGVKVQKALSCDIDHDGQDELILLCWKKGHYGDVKPIWVEEDEQEWVQHIFVYEYVQEDIEAKWMSSYIGRDISDITAKKSDVNGSILCLTDTGGEVTIWAWDSWGFTLVDMK